MANPNVLITGSGGQLGKALADIYPEAQLTDHADLDVSSQAAVASYDWSGIDTIINAAAYTQVDLAETTEGKALAWAVNSKGAENLAGIAESIGATLVHISTDYVFDGTKTEPYTEQDPVNPQNEYGESKAAGDVAVSGIFKHYVLRTSWVIGDGNNFVRTMLKLGQEKDELGIVSDQVGRPTFADDLAQAVAHIDQTRPDYGLYNFSNSGEPVTWADFARAIFNVAGIKCQVKDTSTKEYFAGKEVWAPRPANSVLDLSKIKSTGLKIPNWRDSLEKYINAQA